MKCFACSKEFVPTGKNHRRCGSVTLKTGCSYDWFMFLKRYDPNGKRRKYISIKITDNRKMFFDIRGKKCQKCGLEHSNKSFFEIDHIIPRFKIGSKRSNGLAKKEFSNLQILCPNCHKEKTIIDRKWGCSS